jgi:hypothetical protein
MRDSKVGPGYKDDDGQFTPPRVRGPGIGRDEWDTLSARESDIRAALKGHEDAPAIVILAMIDNVRRRFSLDRETFEIREIALIHRMGR